MMRTGDLALPKPRTLLLKIGNAVSACGSVLGSNYDPVASSPEYSVLSKAGYLVTRPVKDGVWNVELTDLGNQSVSGSAYAHEQGSNCDEWQVSIPLSRYDRANVTGIFEDGVRAKVDVSIYFIVTSAGQLFAEARDGQITLGDPDPVGISLDNRTYFRQTTLNFEKYDDGWRTGNN